MKKYEAIIQHANGKREAVSVTAPDYTKAFLFLSFRYPKTTYIIELTEAQNETLS